MDGSFVKFNLNTQVFQGQIALQRQQHNQQHAALQAANDAHVIEPWTNQMEQAVYDKPIGFTSNNITIFFHFLNSNQPNLFQNIILWTILFPHNGKFWWDFRRWGWDACWNFLKKIASSIFGGKQCPRPRLKRRERVFFWRDTYINPRSLLPPQIIVLHTYWHIDFARDQGT